MKGVKNKLKSASIKSEQNLINTFHFPVDDCECVQYTNYFIAFTHADLNIL